MSVSRLKLLTVLKSKFKVQKLKDFNQNERSWSREATSRLLTRKKCIDLTHQWRISCFIVVSAQTLQRQTDLLTTNYTEDSSNKTGSFAHAEGMEHKQSVNESLRGSAEKFDFADE